MTRIETLMSKLPEGSCALISSDINRRYLTGMKSSAGIVLAFREESYLLIDFRYIEKARDCVKDCTVIMLTDQYGQISELIKKHGAEKIMIEADIMTVTELNGLSEAMIGRAEVDSSRDLSLIIRSMRMIKTDDEIELMVKAQRIAEAALENAFNFIKEGVTEREIALCLDEYMLRNGAEALSFETIALCGTSTSRPHGVPSDEKTLKKGEFVLMDFGAVVDGYHSDMTRTVVLGEPTEEMEKVYSIVLEAQNRTIAAAQAGITGKRLDQVARDFIAANGYGDQFGHGLGHSVGLEIHEYPNANKRCGEVLTDNMIMTIEPGIYLPEKFGVRIEDFVVIRGEKCYNMTNAPKNLIKL